MVLCELLSNPTFVVLLARFIKSFVRIVFGLSIFFVGLIKGRHIVVQGLQMAAFGLGGWFGLCGKFFEYYSPVRVIKERDNFYN